MFLLNIPPDLLIDLRLCQSREVVIKLLVVGKLKYWHLTSLQLFENFHLEFARTLTFDKVGG